MRCAMQISLVSHVHIWQVLISIKLEHKLSTHRPFALAESRPLAKSRATAAGTATRFTFRFIIFAVHIAARLSVAWFISTIYKRRWIGSLTKLLIVASRRGKDFEGIITITCPRRRGSSPVRSRVLHDFWCELFGSRINISNCRNVKHHHYFLLHHKHYLTNGHEMEKEGRCVR
jgi:hypothetical protein